MINVLLRTCLLLLFVISFNKLSWAQEHHEHRNHHNNHDNHHDSEGGQHDGGHVNKVKPANIKCIEPPYDFDTLTGINGYYHKMIGASIILSIVEGRTVADADSSITPEYLESIQTELISKSTLQLNDNNEMLLYKLKYEFNGETWGRFQGFVGDENSTLWVVVTYPFKYANDVEGILLKSLRTLNFDKK